MSATPESLESYLSGRWVRGEGVETRLVDPVKGDELATVSAKGRRSRGRARLCPQARAGRLARLGYAERAKLVGAVADVLVANRARYEAIAIANSGNTKTDAAIDIDGGIGTLKYYARLGARSRRGAHAARREAGAARQGRELPGHSPDGAAPRRRHPHQRVQFPELGPVGEGGGGAARRRAGARQARIRRPRCWRTPW